MPHILRFKNEGTNEDGKQCSDDAQAIYDRYVAENKIVEMDIITMGLAGEYTKIAFATSADCDAFRQEMSDINETGTSGDNRSDVSRYDE
mgnify:FL=1